MLRGLALMTGVEGALTGAREDLDLAAEEAVGDTKLPLHLILLRTQKIY